MNILRAKNATLYGTVLVLALWLPGCDRSEPNERHATDVTAAPETGANESDAARANADPAVATAEDPLRTDTESDAMHGGDVPTAGTMTNETTNDAHMRKAKSDFDREKQRCMTLAAGQRDACDTAAEAAYAAARQEAQRTTDDAPAGTKGKTP